MNPRAKGYEAHVTTHAWESEGDLVGLFCCRRFSRSLVVNLQRDELAALALAEPTSKLILLAPDVDLALVGWTLWVVAHIVLEQNARICIIVVAHCLTCF